MGKERRRLKQVPIATKICKLKEWRDNPKWTVKEAAKRLDVAKGTLLGWKKALWHLLDDPAAMEALGDAFRKKGAGRKKRLKPYELRVLKFYDSCHEDGGTCTFSELLSYAKNNIPEFAILKTGTQESWISRFISDYKNKPVGQPSQVGQQSQVSQPSGDVEPRQEDASSEDDEPSEADEASEDENGPRKDSSNDDSAEPSANGPVNKGSGATNNLHGHSENIDVENGSAESVGDAIIEQNQEQVKSQSGNKPEQKGTVRPQRNAKRKNRDEPIMTVVHQLAGNKHGEIIRIPLYQEDLDSLLPGEWLTSRVVDSLIYKHMIKVDGLVLPLGTSFYLEIANAYCREKNGEDVPDEVTGSFDWTAHKFVLLPISGADHYSFVIIENPLKSTGTICYHINSLRGYHNSASVLDTLAWFLTREAKKCSRETSAAPQLLAYKTSPLQSNSLDCGVYMLHYMHKVARFISEKSPDSVAEKIKSLTSGSFNVTKAGRSRSALLEALQKDRLEVTVIE